MMSMEISSAYNSYASAYTNGIDRKRPTESKTDKANSSSEVKIGTFNYLEELQKKHQKLNLLTGYSNGIPGSSRYPEKIDVTIAPEFLAKMESDPKLAAEYEKNLADIPAACQWGESMIRAMTGDDVYEFRFYIDENGNMSAGSVSGSGRKREMFERSRQKAKQQKEEFDKRIEEHRKAIAEKREKPTNEKRAEKKERLAGMRKSDKEKLQVKLNKAGKERFGARWKGVVFMDKDDENAVVSKAVGLNIDIKA